MNAEQRLAKIVGSGQECSRDEVDPLFARLQPVTCDFMLGTWRGGLFNDHDALAGMLLGMNWYGKRFTGPDHVEPLLCRSADGSLYSYEKLGLARLREVSFRGTVSAAMIYDQRPIIDHFRRVTDDLVVGAMDAKGQPDILYFHLTRTH
ncbi:DUF4334 domain-containing protein [Thermomonospora cellulosilytica]|uniref:DUF4334 domain-containing protein n=1 Tax=Thermomonospora cellulosilytica TaxID=1411118 RepID=A0A7W3MXB3_9ACTN|nr:DUF4334 domain-containing protein [Thermomonospora cellulosilytica]MBA9003576.1 hypothetical protein [Thermomonospora cellulosilytica]